MELIVGRFALARRLEASDARNAALLAAAHADLRPESGATVVEIAGGYAAFAGAGSPLTHAIGIGMNGRVSGDDIDCIEDFYRVRGSAVNIDLCPLADPSLAEILGRRGYRCVEFNNVMVRRFEGAPEPPPAVVVERVGADESAMWSRVLAEGFFEHTPTGAELDIGEALCRMESAVAYLARVDGHPASGGALSVHPDGLATLFGDATMIPFRRRGLQRAIIAARLRDALQQGADLATAATLPGSVSHRNYERCGFRVAYTKLNMLREWS